MPVLRFLFGHRSVENPGFPSRPGKGNGDGRAGVGMLRYGVHRGRDSINLKPRTNRKSSLRGSKEFFPCPGAEITLEANPADLNLSFLESLKTIGIHRLNLGVQSFDPKALEFLGRRHSVEQAVSALESARQAGFADMGLDLIYGIPGQTMNSWMSTLSRAASFSPEHISCYQLTLERGTPLGKASEEGKFSLPPEDDQFSFFMATSEALEKAGFIHYEVSNFARGTGLPRGTTRSTGTTPPTWGSVRRPIHFPAGSGGGTIGPWIDTLPPLKRASPPRGSRRPYPGRPPHGSLFSGTPHQERDRRGSLLPGTWIRPDRGEGQDPEEPGSRGPPIPSGGPSQPHPKRPRASRQPGSHLKNPRFSFDSSPDPITYFPRNGCEGGYSAEGNTIKFYIKFMMLTN